MSTTFTPERMKGSQAGALATWGRAEKTMSTLWVSSGWTIMSIPARWGKTSASFCPAAASSRDADKLRLGVPVEQPRQLDSRVSGHVDDACLHG